MATTKKTQLRCLGVGTYSPAEVERLTGIPLGRILYWLRDPAAHEGPPFRRATPLLQSDLPGARELDVLSFRDMHELRVIHHLRTHDWRMQRIRRYIAGGRQALDTSHPLSSGRMKTDLFCAYLDESGLKDAGDGQLVFEKMVRPFLRNLEFSDMRAVRWRPARTYGDNSILLDPAISRGHPLVDEFFVPTATLARVALASSISKAAIWHEVSESAVKSAIRYERFLDEGVAA